MRHDGVGKVYRPVALARALPPSLPGSTGQPIMPRRLLPNEAFVLDEGDNGSPGQAG
jgi:hypothetical protein